VIAAVMTKLDKRGKGIVLLHDFQQSTAGRGPGVAAAARTIQEPQ
jgi:hypothetical protein